MKAFAWSVVLSALALTNSWGAITVLDFEGIGPYPNNNDIFVADYYNGGAASNGSIGPAYGISFDAPALLVCLNTTTTFCSNASHGGSGDPSSELSGLFFLTSNAITMNVTAGFDTGFSFNYSAVNNPGSVSVYDGLDGTGSLLTSFNLPTTPSGSCIAYGASFCPFFPVGVSFSGTAMSVVFAGVGNQIAFDDITFGSATPGPNPTVPEPTTIGMVGTAAAVAAFRLRRRQRA